MKTLAWSKELTPSDAQQEGGSHNMALRLTKSGMPHDHTTWFREHFFSNAHWTDEVSSRGRDIEVSQVNFLVKFPNAKAVSRNMRVDHDPLRAGNNSAPTTHIKYDDATRSKLESMDLTGYELTLERDSTGNFYMNVQAAI